MGGRVIPQGGRSILNDDVRVLVTERDGAVDLIFILRPEVPEGLLDLVAGRRFTIGADWPIHDGIFARTLGSDLTLILRSVTITGSPDGVTVRLIGVPVQ